MTDGTFQIVALCLVCAMLVLVVKGTSPALALCISAAVCVAVLVMLCTRASEFYGFASEILETGGVDEALFLPLVKVVVIAVLCHLAGEVCRDAGENALASLTELVGTVSGLLVSFPLLEAVWKLLLGLL